MKKNIDLFRVLIVVLCSIITVYCFLIKLPVPLRKFGFELHALFYLLAAAFFNILFLVKKINIHLLIFGMLFLFSALIEFAQEYSNVLLNRRIHGNFDPVDLRYNLLGLSCFSLLWFMYYIVIRIQEIYIKNNVR